MPKMGPLEPCSIDPNERQVVAQFLGVPGSPVPSCSKGLVARNLRLMAQIACGIGPIRVFELESVLEQSGWNNATAVQVDLAR